MMMAALSVYRRLPFALFDRQLSTSTCLSARGMNKTLKGFGVGKEEAENITMEDLESMTDPDMNDLQHISRHVERDAETLQRHVRRKTVEHKYFTVKGPEERNMLTWAMKEQLRYLHSSDPDMWTPDALSQSFPISASGAKKLLKVKWVPKDAAAIEKHDRIVLAQWKNYTKGKLGSAQLLEASLKNKFGMSSGTLPQPIDQDQILATLENLRYEDDDPHAPKSLKPKNKIPKAPKMKHGSFVSIIDNYEAQLQQNKTKSNVNSHEKSLTNRQERCNNVSVITEGVPKYDGRYSQVSVNRESRRKQGTLTRREMGKVMTFSEFMEKKNKSKD